MIPVTEGPLTECLLFNSERLEVVMINIRCKSRRSSVITVGAGKTKRLRNFNSSPPFGFSMVFGFKQNGHFVQNLWKSERTGSHFIQIYNGWVFEWSGP